MSTNATGYSATTIGRVEAIDLDVALVDPMVITRRCEDRVGSNKRLVVEHCYVNRKKGKVGQMKNRHTWFLAGRWTDELLNRTNFAVAGAHSREDAWEAVLRQVRRKF